MKQIMTIMICFAPMLLLVGYEPYRPRYERIGSRFGTYYRAVT